VAAIAGGLGAIVQVGTGSTVLALVVAGGLTAAVITLMLRRRATEAAD
jgi:ABC-type proline/glycine betaine transport system permease subunit